MNPAAAPSGPAGGAISKWIDHPTASVWATAIAKLGQPVVNVTEAVKDVGALVGAAPSGITSGAWDAAKELIKTLAPESVKNIGAATYFGGRLGIGVWAERAAGFPMSYLMQSETYAYQYANPQYLPTQPTIDSLWIMGRIDEELWECFTKAQGNIPQWAKLHRDSMNGQLRIDELIPLWKRGKIDYTTFADRAHKVGWGPHSDFLDKVELFNQLPPLTDLIRMMVRDSADEQVAKEYGYDIGFETKFSGKLDDWAKAQGISGEVARFYWRAHWQIPSATQLYEMMQRFRPDRPEVQQWTELAALRGEPAAVAAFGPKPLVVTVADVKRALQINDMAPTWVDPLVGISYNPMTRTDAVRAFEIGAITSNDLYHRLRDVGYNEADAKVLRDFYEKQSARRAANSTGVLTIRKIVKYYKGYGINRGEAERELRKVVNDEQRIAQLLDGAELERIADHQMRQIGLIRKRFVTGSWTDAETAIELGGQGVQPQDQATLIRRWREEQRTTGKTPTASVLCTWVRKGLISVPEYRDRLSRLGYSPIDVERMAADCFTKRA